MNEEAGIVELIKNMQKLDVADKDVVVVICKDRLHESEYTRLEKAFAKARDFMKRDFRVMIIPSDLEIGVLHPISEGPT